jgi:hypothetical protein
VDDLDIVARIIKQVVGLGLFMREMWRDQSKVTGAELPQQVVERPSDVVRNVSKSRCHPEVPLPRSIDNN